MRIVFGFVLGLSLMVFSYQTIAQVNSNNVVTANINNENAFFDGSQNFDWSIDPTSNGKGFLFPRTDLTHWAFRVDKLAYGDFFPGAFDGMIVYNVGTGTTPIVGDNPTTATEVTPGFYYFSNPGPTDGYSHTTIANGQWIRIADASNLSSTTTGSEFPTSPSEGDVFYRTDIQDYYYYNGTEWGSVSNKWIPAHDYVAGNLVEYGGNFYVANTSFTSDATTFETDAANWNYAGGKDAKYTISEIGMDGQTLTKVAVTSTTVDPADVDNTVATVGYVDANSGSDVFDANRIITRTGLDGITGQNYNTATVAEFLNKVFFPVLSPLVTSFNYNSNTTSGQYSYQTADAETKVVTDHVGSVSIPYSTWKDLTNLSFNYEITLRDGTSSITKVDLLKSGVSQGTVTDGALTGSFSLAASGFTDINATKSVPLTLQVTDDASNIVELLLNTSFTRAIGVALGNARISTTNGGAAYTGSEGAGSLSDPYLIERDGNPFNGYFNWSIIENDDVSSVTDIEFSGAPSLTAITGSNITQTSTAVSFPHADASSVYRVGARARGSIAGDWSTIVYSFYYRMQDKLYCGYLPSNTAPTEVQITGLQQSSLKTTTYYSSTGVTLTNNTGSSGFFAWAVPTYVDGGQAQPAFSRIAYYYATGQWFENSNVTVHYVTITQGSTSTWYWVCIYNASTANGGSVQAKLSN